MKNTITVLLLWECLVLAMLASPVQAQNQQQKLEESERLLGIIDRKVFQLSNLTATNKSFPAKIRQSQKLWEVFLNDHVHSVFAVKRGKEAPTDLSNISATCVNEVQKKVAVERLSELNNFMKQTSEEELGSLQIRYETSDKQLNNAYQKVMHNSDGSFTSSLRRAEVSWIAFRDADAEAYQAAIGKPQAKLSKMIELTIDRTHQLNEWLTGVKEAQNCASTYPSRH